MYEPECASPSLLPVWLPPVQESAVLDPVRDRRDDIDQLLFNEWTRAPHRQQGISRSHQNAAYNVAKAARHRASECKMNCVFR
jgi:hypothetical protein